MGRYEKFFNQIAQDLDLTDTEYNTIVSKIISGIGLLLLTINSSNYYCDEVENIKNMNGER